MKSNIFKAYKKRHGPMRTNLTIWEVALLSSLLLLFLVSPIKGYIYPVGRSNSCVDNGVLSYRNKGIVKRISHVSIEGEVNYCIHRRNLSSERRKMALSMSTSSSSSSSSLPTPTPSSSINKERWRRRKYLLTTFFLHVLTWPLYASFKVLEMGLINSLRLFNFFISLPLISVVGKPIRRTIQDLFNVKLPMLKYLWPKDKGFFSQELRSKLFLLASFSMMFIGKRINLRVPFMLQKAIDTASAAVTSGAIKAADGVLVKKVATYIALYNLFKFLVVFCQEVKTILFAYVSQNVLRKFANNIFAHLHTLDSAFHLKTPSGTISVAYVRAVRGFQTMLLQLVFYVFPAFLELVLTVNILYAKFGRLMASITMLTFCIYLTFTVKVTENRVAIRKEMVESDNERNGFFIDSILNHEIVKLFSGQRKETSRFNSYLIKLQDQAIRTTYAVGYLNLGQSGMFAIGLAMTMLLSLQKISQGTMSVGDLAAVNAMLLQLQIPFNYIGYTYQELRQSYVDMSYMTNILVNKQPAILPDGTTNLPSIEDVAPRTGPSKVEFKNVSFKYDTDPITATIGYDDEDDGGVMLKNVSFTIEPGQSVAIVGRSGSGKSTTLRLITRMLDPTEGCVLIDGVDTRNVSLKSLRNRVTVVPQDTSLFDNTVEYNIKYGLEYSSGDNNCKYSEVKKKEDERLRQVLEKCNLLDTIEKLPDGLKTQVGERGALLSGGERQKVSIARALLKDPTLILCDEVTSAVDAFAERDIVNSLRQATESRTTLTVAHRLSSIQHCDKILVMDRGRIVEQGSHIELLQKTYGTYRRMWEAQNGQYMNYAVDGRGGKWRGLDSTIDTLRNNIKEQIRNKKYKQIDVSDDSNSGGNNGGGRVAITPFRQRESVMTKTSELDKSGLRTQSPVEEDLGQYETTLRRKAFKSSSSMSQDDTDKDDSVAFIENGSVESLWDVKTKKELEEFCEDKGWAVVNKSKKK